MARRTLSTLWIPFFSFSFFVGVPTKWRLNRLTSFSLWFLYETGQTHGGEVSRHKDIQHEGKVLQVAKHPEARLRGTFVRLSGGPGGNRI